MYFIRTTFFSSTNSENSEKFRKSDFPRGGVSYEFFLQSGDMSNLAYIGAKNLNF